MRPVFKKIFAGQAFTKVAIKLFVIQLKIKNGHSAVRRLQHEAKNPFEAGITETLRARSG